ncbi:MAG: helix-turn-helix domain-containing protein [Caldicoprobacterales bacterium]|jgi:transcriptional regulator with XRE-family HTH domain
MKMGAKQSFGSFVRAKRLEADITLRGMAQILDISPVYMSNIETDRNPAPKADILEKLAKALRLDKHEREIMYDLAAQSKNYAAIPGDLPEYISENEYARIALRMAKDVDATDTEWIEFIEKLKKRSGRE